MKDALPEYYPPSADQFGQMVKQATVSVDANVLLTLYKLTPTARAQVVKVLKTLGVRLWIPHQAAKEFHENRLEVLSDLRKRYRNLESALAKSSELVGQAARSRNHPVLEAPTAIKAFEDATQAVAAELKKNLDQHFGSDLEPAKPDPVLDEISKLCEGNVGNPFTESELDNIYSEGRRRYSDAIPPGYKDAPKGGTRQFGDLVLWKQLVDHASKTKRPILFVTEDQKPDWWRVHEDKLVGARPELCREFRAASGTTFATIRLDHFLETSKRVLHLTVEAATIDEAKSLGELPATHREVSLSDWLAEIRQANGWSRMDSRIATWQVHLAGHRRRLAKLEVEADRISRLMAGATAIEDFTTDGSPFSAEGGDLLDLLGEIDWKRAQERRIIASLERRLANPNEVPVDEFDDNEPDDV